MDQLKGDFNFIKEHIIDHTNWQKLEADTGFIDAFSCQDIVKIGNRDGASEEEIQGVLHRLFLEMLKNTMNFGLYYKRLVNWTGFIEEFNSLEINSLPLLSRNPHHWEEIYLILRNKNQMCEWFGELMEYQYQTITFLEKRMEELRDDNIDLQSEISKLFMRFIILNLLRPNILTDLAKLSINSFSAIYQDTVFEKFIIKYYQKMRQFPLDLWWKNPVEYICLMSLLDNEEGYIQEIDKIIKRKEFPLAVELLSLASDQEKIELLKSGDIFHCISHSQILGQNNDKYYQETRLIFTKIMGRKMTPREFQRYREYVKIK